MANSKLRKDAKLRVHTAMEEHIGNFLRSGTFKDIMNLYRLPTTILAFIECRKKVKAQYPKVDVTAITFGDQERGVEENGESSTADFYPNITLKWDRDSGGRTIFPPKFEFSFVAMDEEDVEKAEGDGDGAEVAEVEQLRLLTFHTLRTLLPFEFWRM